jgi:hypothetical protein
LGTYGIGFYTFDNSITTPAPKNGLPFPSGSKIHMDGDGTSDLIFRKLGVSQEMAVNMIQAMKKGGWKLAFENFDDLLTASSIRRADQGGGEVFAQANIGIFVDHGDYGTDPDYSAGASGSTQTYFASPFPGSGNDPWVRMCQFGFGNSNRWMTILACNSLRAANVTSMVNAGGLPLKETHIVCGCGTIAGVDDVIGQYWAQNMVRKNQAVVDSWFNAGKKGYTGIPSNSFTDPVIFSAVGYPECMSDTVSLYTNPTSPSPTPGNLTSRTLQVWP